MLWTVIKEATDEDMGDFRGRAFEALTFVGLAVGPDVFENDGKVCSPFKMNIPLPESSSEKSIEISNLVMKDKENRPPLKKSTKIFPDKHRSQI